MRLDTLIEGVLLTEKVYAAASVKPGFYAFRVNKNATKYQIRDALKKFYGVDVIKINTNIVRGKVIRKAASKKAGPKEIKRPNFKKAYVQLKSGQTLPSPASPEAPNAAVSA